MVTKTKLNVWYAIKYASLNSTWTTNLDGVPKTSVSQAQANVRIAWKAWETRIPGPHPRACLSVGPGRAYECGLPA